MSDIGDELRATKPKPDHLIRPLLPWRDPTDGLTECGLTAEGHRWITLAEANQRIKAQGGRRAAFTLCMTCVDTVNRHQSRSFDEQPCGSLLRELEWAWGRLRWQRSDMGDDAIVRARRIDIEVRAIGALVEAHREEFDEFVAGHADTEDLTARRVARAAAARYATQHRRR